MRRRLLVLAVIVTASLAVGGGLLAGAPGDLGWRTALLGAKLRGGLPDIPLLDLLRWSLPGSPVYLAALAEQPNPHAAIRNAWVGADEARQGAGLYLRHCAQCHGAGGRGQLGPDLVEAVARRSDWSFLSAVKWGRPGTSMTAQGLPERDVWRIHAWLREAALVQADGRQAETAQPAARAPIEVPADAILDSDRTPEQWLTYAGNYAGHRHSLLQQLTRDNVGRLRLAWAAQLRHSERELQVSPIVAGRTMYVTESGGGVIALDAGSGDVLWSWQRPIPPTVALCCGAQNRGAAILGRTVFVATLDAHLVALDANTGALRWTTRVADVAAGYTMTAAPLAFGDRVVVGVAGGEFGIRGFVAAYAAADGRRLWKFDTVPGPGEPGHETWAGDSWRTGGAPTWATGAYDPQQQLVIWGTGNPGPTYRADVRAGDNLYSNSVVALDAASGRLRWHYQFTPSDTHDWDAAQQPVLAELERDGARRPVVLWANRNGFFYALDRRTGEFLFARAFARQTWNEGFDANGRPRMAKGIEPTKAGTLVWPAPMAATHWWPPSYDASRQLMFVPSADAAALYFRDDEVRYVPGRRFDGGAATPYSGNHPASASIKAIDAATGEVRWRSVVGSGGDDFVWTVGSVLSTRTGLVFAGYRNVFRGFDADTGRELWRVGLGGKVRGSPVSYAVDGRQHVAVAAGSTLFVFALPEP